MKPKISVIVPVYKVEKYLCECIDSILAQTYTNLEIILVDDGSPDNCGKICDEYAKKDNRIIVIHKENGGVSDARNAGLDIATGDYIGFVDPDDKIESDMYEFLYNNLIFNDADISCCGAYHFYVNNIFLGHNISEKFSQNSEEAIHGFFNENRLSWAVWNKLYRADICNDIRFPVDITRSEDLIFLIETMVKSNKVLMDNTPKYYYRRRSSSTTGQKGFSPATMQIIESVEYASKIIENKININIDNRAILLRISFYALGEMIFCKKFYNLPEYKNISSKIKNNLYFILKNPYFGKTEKILALGLKINKHLFRLLYKLKLNFDIKSRGILFE